MTIEITNTSGIACKERDLHSLLEFSIEELGLHSECDLNVLLVNEEEMTELHIKWMGEQGPTDVLSFPMDEVQPHSQEEAVLGDIVICPKIAQTQADSAGHSFEHELSILGVHGLLHLVGYDHADSKDEKIMFDLQEDLVSRWNA